MLFRCIVKPSAAASAPVVLLMLTLVPSAQAQRRRPDPYAPVPGSRVDSVGYLPNAVKHATVAGAAADVTEFRLMSVPDGAVALTAKLGPPVVNHDSGETVRLADFSTFAQAGTYAIRVAGIPDSPPFEIKPGVYNEALRTVMLGFYGQRCGVPVSFDYQGIQYEKGACHLQDGYLDYYEPAQAGTIKDGTGGWHDAGDYGKYVVNAAFATGLMLAAWEDHHDALARLELPIPEASGPLPDFLAEVKFNLDWILKMQFPDGRVSHKLTRTSFSPMIMPTEDKEKRYFAPWGTLATTDFAAVAFKAARVFAPFDPAYADRCKKAAELAVQANRKQWWEVRPDQSALHTGGYIKSPDSDRVWALAEMWETTGDPELRTQLERSLVSDNLAVDVDWDWGSAKNLGVYVYLTSKRERDPRVVASLTADLVTAADRIVANHDAQGYGRGLRSYYWGCNGSLARLAFNLLMAQRLTGDKRYRDVLIDQLAYLYGRNPYGRSFVTGEGFNPPMFPHHRPSTADGIEAPWPGHLVGGGHPTELDWHDLMPDAPTNENAINWDAALVYALAAFYDPQAR